MPTEPAPPAAARAPSGTQRYSFSCVSSEGLCYVLHLNRGLLAGIDSGGTVLSISPTVWPEGGRQINGTIAGKPER